VGVVIMNDITIDVKLGRAVPAAVMEFMRVKVVHTLDCSVPLVGKSQSGHGNSRRKQARKVTYQAAYQVVLFLTVIVSMTLS